MHISASVQFRTHSIRGVAQSGSALDLGSSGRRFESCLPDQLTNALDNILKTCFPIGEGINRNVQFQKEIFMFKHLALAAAALCCVAMSAQVQAQPAASVTVASDYSWRGISFNNYSGAAVQGDMNYTTGYGLTAGAWVGNIAMAGFGGYEFDPYLNYAHNFGDIQVYGTFMWYTFARSAVANTLETTAGVKMFGANISASWIPQYFGADTSSMYYQGNYAYQINDKFWFVPQVGYTNMGEAIQTLWDSYFHYKLGLQYRQDKYTMEMFYSETNRNLNNAVGTSNGKTQDDAMIVSLTMQM